MGELATFEDAYNAGFEVYLYDFIGAMSRPNPYPAANWPNGATQAIQKYNINEFITKSDFKNDAGNPYHTTENHTRWGVKPVPTTLSLYSNNEFIEKSDLVIPIPDVIWNLQTYDVTGNPVNPALYLFTPSSYPNTSNPNMYPANRYDFGENIIDMPLQVFNVSSNTSSYLNLGDRVEIYYLKRNSSGGTYLYNYRSITITNTSITTIDIRDTI